MHLGLINIEFGIEKKRAFTVKNRKKKVGGNLSFIYCELNVFGKVKIFIYIDS